MPLKNVVLHVRSCLGCHRIAIRLDGDNEWVQWRQPGTVQDIKHTYTVATLDQGMCTECQTLRSAGVGTQGLEGDEIDD